MTWQEESTDFKDNQNAVEQRVEMDRSFFNSDKYMQIIAWLLLSIGLCIICCVFFLTLDPQNAYRKFGADSHYPDYEAKPKDSATEDNHQLGRYVKTNTDSNDLDNHFNTDLGGNVSSEGNSELDFEFTHLRFLQTAAPIEPTWPTSSLVGCKYLSCRIICTQNSMSLYSEVSQLLNGSRCEAISALVLQEQTLGISNKWLAATQSVRSIVLVSSKVTNIDRGAFNAPIFATTTSLYMNNLQLENLDDNALLGLPSLRALKISVSLPNLTFAFLQPLRMTLSLLRLNVDLIINTNESLFGQRQFKELTHLDLSRNIFDGALKRQMFCTTPNLEVLYIKYAKITSIEHDVFDDLAGTLNTLNLAYNELKSLSAEVLRPLLTANGININMELEPNEWHCDCLLYSFAELYAEHSKRFLSTVTCKEPFSFHGNSLRILLQQQLNCRIESNTLPLDIQATSIEPHHNDLDIKVSCLKPRELIEGQPSENITLIFEKPIYNLELTLYLNQSVKAEIKNFNSHDKLNIIWFSERFENEQQTDENPILENNCRAYMQPYLLIESLNANRTYTFCMMKSEVDTISPLNCQPLHVSPRYADEDVVEIIENEKQFTIGMLCLIFFMSAFFGGIIAYFGIKAYPDLLEGSKHVLVVKKSEKTCYISTISETDYITKTSSVKNRPLSCTSKLSQTLPELHKSPSTMCVKELGHLSSLKSSSTCFAESFSNITYQEDEYEMPKSFDKPTDSLQHCKLNNYAMSPSSPPPLPKRNVDMSELIVMNRFSKINNAFEP